MTVMTASGLYEVLGVSRHASDEQITRAYKAAIRQYHPDNFDWKNPDRVAQARECFSLLGYVHDTLTNEGQRRAYDDGDTHIGDIQLWMTIEDKLHYLQEWKRFISVPYDWADTSKPMAHVWKALSGLALVQSVTVFGLILWPATVVYLFAFTLATRSAPFTYTGVPLQVGIVCAVLATATTITACVYFVSLHPHSRKRSTQFRRFFLDRIVSMLVVPAWFGAVFGVIVGHYLF